MSGPVSIRRKWFEIDPGGHPAIWSRLRIEGGIPWIEDVVVVPDDIPKLVDDDQRCVFRYVRWPVQGKASMCVGLNLLLALLLPETENDSALDGLPGLRIHHLALDRPGATGAGED